MEKLSDKQNEILNAVKKYLAIEKHAPTIRELCDITGLTSTASVKSYLDKLEKKGYIRKQQDKNRTIELLVTNEYEDKKNLLISIPLVTKLTLDNMSIEDDIRIPENFVNKKKNTFAYLNRKKYKDLLLGINDLIIFEKIDDEDKIKNNDLIIGFKKDKVIITYDWKGINILGKVIGVYKKYS